MGRGLRRYMMKKTPLGWQHDGLMIPQEPPVLNGCRIPTTVLLTMDCIIPLLRYGTRRHLTSIHRLEQWQWHLMMCPVCWQWQLMTLTIVSFMHSFIQAELNVIIHNSIQIYSKYENYTKMYQNAQRLNT